MYRVTITHKTSNPNKNKVATQMYNTLKAVKNRYESEKHWLMLVPDSDSDDSVTYARTLISFKVEELAVVKELDVTKL